MRTRNNSVFGHFLRSECQIIVSILCFILNKMGMVNWLGSTLTLNRMDTQPTFYTTTSLPFQCFLLAKFLFKDTHREKAHSDKIPTLTRSMNIDVWVVGRMSSLLEIFIPNQNFQKKKKKRSSYLQSLIGPFCTPHSICFNMASDRFAWKCCTFNLSNFSTLVFWKNFSFFVFFQVKILKMLKIFSDCHIKT